MPRFDSDTCEYQAGTIFPGRWYTWYVWYICDMTSPPSLLGIFLALSGVSFFTFPPLLLWYIIPMTYMVIAI